MMKNIVKLEIKINERDYQFLCDNDSPLDDIKNCLNQYMNFIDQVHEQAKKQQEESLKNKSTEEIQIS